MLSRIAVATALVGFAGLAAAQINTINSYKVETRNFNDLPTSTLNVTNSYSNVRFEESFPFPTAGGFANRHFAHFSNDGGVSKYQFNGTDSFEISFNVRLNAGYTDTDPTGGYAARKEAGLYVFNNAFDNAPPYIDEGRFGLFNEGEVATFGGLMPFTGFGLKYTQNTVAKMTLRYWDDSFTGGAARLQVIFEDAVNGVFDSGVKDFDPGFASSGFRAGTTFAFLAQNSRNPLVNDFADTEYNNLSITLIPAPGAAALLGLAGLAVGRRRR